MKDKLKKLMEKDLSKLDDNEKEELFNIIKECQFFVPVEVTQGDNGIEEVDPIRIKSETGELVTPIFTDLDEMHDETMLTVELDTIDLVNVLENCHVEGVVINPFSKIPMAITVNTLSQLFLPDFELVIQELRGLLHQNSTTLASETEVYLRSKEPLEEEFIPEIPLNASSNRDFRDNLEYLNILKLSKGDKLMYVGDLVDENERPDVVIAPETVFKLVSQDGNEYTWECVDQPFYD